MAAAMSSVEVVAKPVTQTSTASSDLPVDVHPAYAGEGSVVFSRLYKAYYDINPCDEDIVVDKAACITVFGPREHQTRFQIRDPSVEFYLIRHVSLFMCMVARLKRPGWEARWGSEEKDRVAGVLAGVMDVEGAAAGFEMAGGLDTTASADGDSAATAIPTEVHPEGDSLPNDIAELKEMVGGFRFVLPCCFVV